MKRAITSVLTGVLSGLLVVGGVVATEVPVTAAPVCSSGELCVYQHVDYKGKWFGTRTARSDWSCLFIDRFCSVTRQLNDKDSSWRNRWQIRSVRVYQDKDYGGRSFCLSVGQWARNFHEVDNGFQDRGSSHKNANRKSTCP